VLLILGDRDREGTGRPAVALQQSSDLALDRATVQRRLAFAMRRSRLASAVSICALKRSCMAFSFSPLHGIVWVILGIFRSSALYV